MTETSNTTPPTSTRYELVGGEAALRRVVDRFYDLMDADPQAEGIRAMHAADLGPMREKLFDWLSGWLGGPTLYFKRPDKTDVAAVHEQFRIGPSERDQWMACMRRALIDEGLSGEALERVETAFARMAQGFRTY